MSPSNELIISIVTVGELRSIAQQNKWGEKKVARMIEMLDDFAIIDINVEEIIDRYAAIDTYSQGKLEHRPTKFSARNMGKNDLWIAATASVYNVELITTDKDFDHLKGEYIKLNRINLDDYKNE
jgi:predicted nucleic acid-binding protein